MQCAVQAVNVHCLGVVATASSKFDCVAVAAACEVARFGWSLSPVGAVCRTRLDRHLHVVELVLGSLCLSRMAWVALHPVPVRCLMRHLAEPH